VNGHVHHWRHGWIPLDHYAALVKTKGNHAAAAKFLNTSDDAHGTGSKVPTPSASVARLNAKLGDRGGVHGFTDDMDHLAVHKALKAWEALMDRFPNVKTPLRVESTGRLGRGVNGVASARLDPESKRWEIGSVSLSPGMFRQGSNAENSFRTNVENGHFHDAPDGVTHTVTHEFGHVLDFHSQRKIQPSRIARKMWTAEGVEKSGVDLWMRRQKSGYATESRDETIAEAFVDAEVNGGKATPFNRALHAELTRLAEQVTA
jgi:hypothetical protein